MTAFTPLEQTAISAIVDEAFEQRSVIKQQLDYANVLTRVNTGRGFYTEFDVPTGLDRLDATISAVGLNVYLGIEGLAYGLGMILHFKDGCAHLLEGYSIGGDTSAINFACVRYALIAQPGPLPTNVA